MVQLHQQRQGKHNEDQNLLPTTVVDQIRLWEHERRRIKHVEGMFQLSSFSLSLSWLMVWGWERELIV